MIDKRLLALITCPSCGGKLASGDHSEQVVCSACLLAYPVRNGVPILIPAEAHPLRENSAGTLPRRKAI